MQLTWLRSPLQRVLAVTAGVALAAGVSVGIWHQLNAGPTGTTVYSGVQAATSNNGNGNGQGNVNPNGNVPHSFTISGTLADVFPGQGTGSDKLYVYLTVDNTNNQPIQVTSLSLKVGDASTGCSATNLSPVSETVNFSVVVPKNSSLGGTTFPMPISMSASAPDDCQRAKFNLTLTGTATGPA
jgi:hypothetical protein